MPATGSHGDLPGEHGKLRQVSRRYSTPKQPPPLWIFPCVASLIIAPHSQTPKKRPHWGRRNEENVRLASFFLLSLPLFLSTNIVLCAESLGTMPPSCQTAFFARVWWEILCVDSVRTGSDVRHQCRVDRCWVFFRTSRCSVKHGSLCYLRITEGSICWKLQRPLLLIRFQQL